MSETLTREAIEAIDCDTFKIDILQRKDLLHVVRALFTSTRSPGWNGEMSDADLFVHARAKYNGRPLNDSASRTEALKDYETWTLQAKVPYYICSFYKEGLRSRLAKAA